MSKRKTKLFKLTRQIKKLRTENNRLTSVGYPRAMIEKPPEIKQDFKTLASVGKLALIIR